MESMRANTQQEENALRKDCIPEAWWIFHGW